MAVSRDPYQIWLGIPPGQQPPNYYRLLGLEEFETRPELIEAAAQRQTARLLGVPAGARGAEVQKLLAEIAAARLCLLQPARKLAYDEALRQQNATGFIPAECSGAESLPQLLAEPDHTARRPKRRRVWQRWLAVCGAAMAVGLAAWLFFAPGKPPPADGTLVIDFPEPLRAGASLRIAGQPREIPPLGPVEYRCPAGEVRVEVAIAGRPEWQRTVTIHPGHKHLVTLPWETISPARAPPGASAGESTGASRQPAPRADMEAASTLHTDPKTGTSTPAHAHLAAEGAVTPKVPANAKPPERASPQDGPQAMPPPPAAGAASAPVEAGAASVGAGGDQPERANDAPEPPGGGSPAGNIIAQPRAPSPAAPRTAAPVPMLAEFDRPLAEAWGAIRAGDGRRGYEQILELFKQDRGDMRVAFSMGLLEALVAHNWPEAEKRFALCQRLSPEHPAVLNNLALVRLRTGQEHLALRHWEAFLASHPAPPEVVQNLRRFQALAHSGQVRLAASRLKTLDELAARAAEDGTPLRPNIGFLYLPLKVPAGETVGWKERRFYHDRWCAVCNGRGAVRCPDPDCARGTVRASAPRLLYVDPLTRTRVVQSVPVRAACRVCKGEGWIDCKRCNRGIDPSLKDAQDPLAQTPSASH